MPCHRVVGAGGALGGYGAHLDVKRQRLRAEGLTVGFASVRNFRAARWPTPSATRRRGVSAGPRPTI